MRRHGHVIFSQIVIQKIYKKDDISGENWCAILASLNCQPIVQHHSHLNQIVQVI